jgi:predicted Zn-dependent protease
LGRMYLTRGRLTGDTATCQQAQDAIEHAARLAPGDVETQGLLPGLRYSIHDLAGAADAARQLLAQRPDQLPVMATLGDAQLELVEHYAAASTYDRLAQRAPDSAAAFVRQARLAFLQGRR